MADQNNSRRRGMGSSEIPSRKSDRMVCHRNRVGHEYVHLLEFDPAVDAYQEYPRTIRYLRGSDEESYTPDSLVIWRNRSPGIVVTTIQEKVDDPPHTSPDGPRPGPGVSGITTNSAWSRKALSWRIGFSCRI